MAAIKFETRVDESTVGVLPELRPLVGQDVLLVAVACHDDSGHANDNAGKITFDDFLRDHQLTRPEHIAPVSLEDMERAIARGAVGGDV